MPGEITLQQMFQTETITGVISRFKTPLSRLQDFYGLGIGGPNSENQAGRYVGWDIFDKTRTLARGRAPNTGPATVTQKAVGHVSAQVFRLHEKIPIHYEQIFRTRPPGSAWGTVDASGQNYIARQLQYGTQRFRNAREFMVSRMFRGGWGVQIVGDDWNLVEFDDANASFTVDVKLPSAHKNQLELGSGANIITSPWDDPSSQVIRHIESIDAAFERISGRPLQDIWINSDLYNDLILNTELQAVGGAVYRTWDSQTAQGGTNPDGIKSQEFAVVFRALPRFTFHVYNGVLSFQTDGTTAALTSKLIPDNYALFTPAPGGDWLSMVNGSEIVQEDLGSAPKEVFGFHNWKTPVIDPAGIELKLLDNCLPAPPIPTAWAYGKVKNF